MSDYQHDAELAGADREVEALRGELKAERERGDRLARGYIALAEYTYGPKRLNAFRLVMKYHGETRMEDFAPVREQIDAEIASLDDWCDPADDEEGGDG